MIRTELEEAQDWSDGDNVTGVKDMVTIEPSRSTEQTLGLRRMLYSRSQVIGVLEAE